MLDVKRILFATDFSDCAQAALPHAIAFAEAYDAELHMLHCLVLHSGQPVPDDEPFEGEEEAREALGRAAQRGGSVRHEVRRGIAPAPAILDYADEHGIDLIVIGSHGRRGVRRLLLGSVAEEVARLSACPVLTVRWHHGGAEEAPTVSRVLAPVDFSQQSAEGVRAAHDLAAKFRAELLMLHVVELPTVPDFYGAPADWNADPLEVMRRSKDRLARLAVDEELSHDDVNVSGASRVGRAHEEIVDHAEEMGTDLIVIPSHGRTGFGRLMLGSVAERVMRRAPCSVLTIRAAEEPGPEEGREADATLAASAPGGAPGG